MPYTGYDPHNYDPNARPSYDLIPIGDHRVRISKAEWYTSKNSGKESIKIEFDVSGFKSRLWYYIGTSFTNADEKAKLDQRLGEFFDSFNMRPTMNLAEWTNRTGGVRVKHEVYEGDETSKVAWILRRDKTDLLPPWQNPDNGFKGSAPLDVSDASFNGPPAQSYRTQSAGMGGMNECPF